MYTLRSSGVRARYSRSIRPSMRFLMNTGEGKKRDFNCDVTSETSRLCCKTDENKIKLTNVIKIVMMKIGRYDQLTAMRLRAFIMRTIAASISCFRSSSTLPRVSLRSGSDSPLAATVCILTLQQEQQVRQH